MNSEILQTYAPSIYLYSRLVLQVFPPVTVIFILEYIARTYLGLYHEAPPVPHRLHKVKYIKTLPVQYLLYLTRYRYESPSTTHTSTNKEKICKSRLSMHITSRLGTYQEHVYNYLSAR